jgi:hypothetical protein
MQIDAEHLQPHKVLWAVLPRDSKTRLQTRKYLPKYTSMAYRVLVREDTAHVVSSASETCPCKENLHL